MEPVSLVISAIKMMATAAGTEIIKKEVGPAYDKLKALISRRGKEKEDDGTNVILKEFEQKPDLYEKPLEDKLTTLGVGNDGAIIAAARALLQILPRGQQVLAKYNIENRGTTVVVENGGTVNIHPPGTEPEKSLQLDDGGGPSLAITAYLEKVMADNRVLALEGVDPGACNADEPLHLSGVYTPLFALAGERGEEIFKAGEMHGERSPDSLVELVNDQKRKHWVFLGDPGYGKSTFLNYLSFCLAGELLESGEGNLELLKTQMPDGSGETPEPYAWELGPLLPLKVVLRDLAAQEWLRECRDGLGDYFWEFFAASLPPDIRENAPEAIRKVFRDKGGLILLDGLDEMPESGRAREGIKRLIRELETGYARVKIVVTSRPYAYQKPKWQIPGFHMARLTRFSGRQIHTFIDRWYRHAAIRGRLAESLADTRSGELKTAIERTPSLMDFAGSPLLLTQLASLHAFKGGKLPEKREELYAASLDLLLDVWERHKTDTTGECGLEEPGKGLSESLGLKKDDLLKAIQMLAFVVHQTQGGTGGKASGTADIPKDLLIKALVENASSDEIQPKRLESYLACRAGILVDRGEGVYSFPHRTFQEYLAARHLTENDDYDELVRLVLDAPLHWREVGLLAAAKIHSGGGFGFWALVDEWCVGEAPEPGNYEKVEPRYLWGALMAGMAVAESVNPKDKMTEARQARLERLRGWLLRVMTGSELPALERVAAGNALAAIGDPRFDPENYFLPKEADMGFITVPAGEFKMGTPESLLPQLIASYDGDEGWAKNLMYRESPCHEVYLSEFRISQYPLTKSQYRTFVQATGRDNHGFEKYGQDTHPVVGVNWEDAVAYCEWLDKKQLFPGWRVVLPTEAQWEKAARQGSDALYPWGNEITPEQANMSETAVRETSPVGCFNLANRSDVPSDMLGNTWEWCRDWYNLDYYKNSPYENPIGPDEGSLRVMRGGSFLDRAGLCRSAYRRVVPPSSRYRYFGFRLALLPGRQARQA